jgi:hypothetical protein
MDKSDYLDKMNIWLHSGVYEHIQNDPMANTERKVEKLLSKHKLLFTPAQQHK